MKRVALLFLSFLFAASAGAQTAAKHVSLGMDISEFAAKFDPPTVDTEEARSLHAAVLEATYGGRVRIRMNVDGHKASYLFDKGELREMEITAGNPYAHELKVLTAALGPSQTAGVETAVWDRKDGTRFTLTSREGTGVLLVTPTPVESK